MIDFFSECYDSIKSFTLDSYIKNILDGIINLMALQGHFCTDLP